MKSILYDSNLNHVYDAQQIFPIKDIVKQLNGTLQIMQQNRLEIEYKVNLNLEHL